MKDNDSPSIFTLNDLLWFADLTQSAGIEWYLDGGWGVDALLGEQTRTHGDLDIAILASQSAVLRSLLTEEGFKEVPKKGSWEHNYVLSDGKREIDIHSYELNPDGSNKLGVAYEARHLQGVGTIAGREFKGVPPDIMIEFHTGYELDFNDWHDVKRLANKYNIAIPKDYEQFQRVIT